MLLVQSLSLRNFRNYETLDLDFEPSGNLFLGANAQGKTNLLEAIHCFCLARSHRQVHEDELIRHGADHFLLRGNGVGGGNRKITVQIRALREGGRKLKINGVIHRKISDLIGRFYVVSLSPEDVKIVGGSPHQRRHFLNFCICQTSLSYWTSLLEYGRVLKQRNIALKSFSSRRWRAADTDELEAWGRQLASVGSRIMRKRGEVLRKLDPEVSLFHQQISDGGERLSLTYKPAFELAEDGDIEEQFIASLGHLREKEINYGMSLVGPHRDDVLMTVNGEPLRVFGSQGQQRTASIALKLAAARFLEKASGERPILLLDDVFAELDQERTRLLFDLLAEFGQLFIVTAKESDLAGGGQNLRKMLVANGTVTNI
ncbi:DNA replication/repair protein RecF [bacterium]|nr:DNA replication/repair protein RecF [bacterium]